MSRYEEMKQMTGSSSCAAGYCKGFEDGKACAAELTELQKSEIARLASELERMKREPYSVIKNIAQNAVLAYNEYRQKLSNMEMLAAYEEAIPFERIAEAADLLNHKAPKTLREDFMENYPHAILDEFGYPNDTCPAALLGASCPYTDKPTCMRCPMWDKPAK